MNFEDFIKYNFKGGHLYTFVGGGGKSSLIYSIGDLLVENGYRVRISTTTKFSSLEFINYNFKQVNSLEYFNKVINIKNKKIVLFSKKCNIKNKCYGFLKKWWENLLIPKDVIILIEGDGSRRKPIKIPKRNEPVVPNNSSKVFLIVGSSIINKKIIDKNTYNIEGIKQIDSKNNIYNIKILSNIIFKGWKKIHKKYNMIVILNQGDLLDKVKEACKLSFNLFVKFKFESYVVSAKKKKIYMSNYFFIRGIILSAGKSKRMKKLKCLLKFRNTNFLQRSINLLNRVTKEIFIAVGYKKEKIIKYLKNENCKIINISKYYEGMGESLKKIVQELPKGDGFFVHFCDLPLIDDKVIDILYKKVLKNNNNIIIPTYKGVRGHPVYFPEKSKVFFKTLNGDKGAKKILKNFKIDEIEINCKGIIKDIDTIEEYKNMGE